MPTGEVIINNKKCRIALDWTSDRSFVTSEFANAIDALTMSEKDHFMGLNQQVGSTTDCTQLQIKVGSKNFSFKANITDKICELPAVNVVPYKGWVYIENRAHRVADKYPRPAVKVDCLLGQNVLPFYTAGSRRPWRNSLSSTLTTNGDILLHGIIPVPSISQDRSHVFLTSNLPDEDELIRRLLDLEHIGISSNDIDSDVNIELQETMQMFLDITSYDESRSVYETGILWKHDCPNLEGSYDKCVARWLQQERKLERFPDHKVVYHDTIMKFIDREDVVFVPQSEVGPDKDSFFLPHGLVFKYGNTDPRVVFDGAGTDRKGRSLNSQIRQCPNNTANIVAVLLNSRQNELLLSADISKMYMSIELRESDQPYVQFVWRPEPSMPLLHYKFKKVVWGLADSSFKAIEVLKMHSLRYAETHPQAVELIRSTLYVDDLFAAIPRNERNVQLIDDIQMITKSAGYNLRKWISSDPKVLEHLPPELRRDEDIVSFSEEETVKTLGLQWNAVDDCILFKSQLALIDRFKAIPDKKVTKRDSVHFSNLRLFEFTSMRH